MGEDSKNASPTVDRPANTLKAAADHSYSNLTVSRINESVESESANGLKPPSNVHRHIRHDKTKRA